MNDTDPFVLAGVTQHSRFLLGTGAVHTKTYTLQPNSRFNIWVDEADAAEEHQTSTDLLPLYEFEPSPEEVLDAVLPQYVRHRIYNCMLQAAASELAARQRAMKSATDNAEELIKTYTRLANQARQAEITQEISEIVGGANALADAK